MNIAFPKILADLDTDRAGLSWVLSGYNSSATGSFDAAFTFVAIAGLLSGLLMWALYRPPVARTVALVPDHPFAAVS